MRDNGIWWSAKLGTIWVVWPDGLRSPELAKMLRISKDKAKLRYDTTPGRRHERVAQILLRAATGRIVALEEITLGPATADEIERWRKLERATAIMAGKGPGGPQPVQQQLL